MSNNLIEVGLQPAISCYAFHFIGAGGHWKLWARLYGRLPSVFVWMGKTLKYGKKLVILYYRYCRKCPILPKLRERGVRGSDF